jgi:hypothetical protein
MAVFWTVMGLGGLVYFAVVIAVIAHGGDADTREEDPHANP